MSAVLDLNAGILREKLDMLFRKADGKEGRKTEYRGTVRHIIIPTQTKQNRTEQIIHYQG